MRSTVVGSYPVEFKDKKTIFDYALAGMNNINAEERALIKTLNNSVDGIFEVRKITHSNFELFLEPGNLDYTNMKIKSYFEAELLNLEFEKYVLLIEKNVADENSKDTFYRSLYS